MLYQYYITFGIRSKKILIENIKCIYKSNRHVPSLMIQLILAKYILTNLQLAEVRRIKLIHLVKESLGIITILQFSNHHVSGNILILQLTV